MVGKGNVRTCKHYEKKAPHFWKGANVKNVTFSRGKLGSGKPTLGQLHINRNINRIFIFMTRVNSLLAVLSFFGGKSEHFVTINRVREPSAAKQRCQI